MESLSLIKEFKIDEISNPVLSIKFDPEYLNRIVDEVESINARDVEDDDKRNELKPFALELGVPIRSNSAINTVVNNINTKINELRENDF